MSKTIELGQLITPAKKVRCGDGAYPVLSMTMRNGLVFQGEKFKKIIASKDTSNYKVVYRNQLVIGFPIDEGVLATQRIVDVGIVSPAYGIWDVDKSQVLPEFLEYALRCDRAIAYYKAKLRGSTARRRSLPTPTLLAFTVPLPSVDEQKAIVRKVGKMKSVIKNYEAQLSKLDELVKARFVEMFGSIKKEQLLGEISEFVTVGIANSATHAYTESGIPMLRNQNIRENHLDDTDLVYIKPEFAAKYEAKKLKENDIIAMRTGYPGIACLVPKKYEGCQTFTTLIVRLRPGNNPSYVCSYINSDLGKRFIDSGKVGVAQQNFGAKSFAKMPIKIASKELQDKYADFVKQIDKSKVAVQKSLDEAQLLFDSLMQKYFG